MVYVCTYANMSNDIYQSTNQPTHKPKQKKTEPKPKPKSGILLIKRPNLPMLQNLPSHASYPSSPTMGIRGDL